MGTNYYYRINLCSNCNRFDSLHIGKSSKGWTFIFRGYREEKLIIESYKQLINHLKKGGNIFNEYGKEIILEEFMKMIEKKKISPLNYSEKYEFIPGNWIDEEGHSFTSSLFN